MLTELRWRKEIELMRDVFPQFQPFLRCSAGAHQKELDPALASELVGWGGSCFFGFEGSLRGARTNRLYRVVLEGEPNRYPQSPPNVYMEPMLGHCWIGIAGRRNLCVTRSWRPAQSTFANTLLVVIKYIDEHDGRPDAM
jgi:hypothetical protein